MPQHTTPVTRARIITKLEEGWSIRAAAEAFHLNKNSVLKMKKRWELEGTVQRKAGSGRPKISTDVEDTQLINYLRENPFHTARDAIVNINFPGSQPTVVLVFKRYNFGKIWSLATKKCSKVPMTDMFVFTDHAELDLMRTMSKPLKEVEDFRLIHGHGLVTMV
jgi:hypothetical protein